MTCALLSLALAGCASHPAPTEQLRLTDQAIAQAKAVGAGDELAAALAKRAEAELQLADGDNKAARMLAEQAELDARLAEARVLNSKMDVQIQDMSGRIGRLRDDLGNTP